MTQIYAAETVRYSREADGTVRARISPFGAIGQATYAAMLADVPVKSLPVWFLEHWNCRRREWFPVDRGLNRAINNDIVKAVNLARNNPQYQIALRVYNAAGVVGERVMAVRMCTVLAEGVVERDGTFLRIDAAQKRVQKMLNPR